MRKQKDCPGPSPAKQDGPSPAKRRRTRASLKVSSSAVSRVHEDRTVQKPEAELSTPQKAKANVGKSVETTPDRQVETPRRKLYSPDPFVDHEDDVDKEDNVDIVECSLIDSQTEAAPRQFGLNASPESTSPYADPIGSTVCQPRSETEDDDCVHAAATTHNIIHPALLEGHLGSAVTSCDELGQYGVLHSSGKWKSQNTQLSSHKLNVTIFVADLGVALTKSSTKDLIPDLPEDPSYVYLRASVDGEALYEHCEGEFVPGKKSSGDQGRKLLIKEKILESQEIPEEAPIPDQQ